MSPNLPKATLWRLGLAAAAGVWLGRKIHPAVLVIVSGAVLTVLPKRSRIAAVKIPSEPSPWPEAPVAPPFVPHTQAWDELREAISPIVHTPTSKAGE